MSTGVAQKWKLLNVLECLLFSEHQDCPGVEFVEFVGLPRFSEHQGCPDVEVVEIAGMQCDL